MTKQNSPASKLNSIDQSFLTDCVSYSDCLRKLGLCINSRYCEQLKKIIVDKNFTIEHFTPYARIPKFKWPIAQKSCPVCNETFVAKVGSKREQQVCSRSCANTFFRSGEEHGSYKTVKELKSNEAIYRRICFAHHPRKCSVCEESVIVEVHHIDGDHFNNEVSNLVPLCPTHHKYIHSRHRILIQDRLENYLEIFSGGTGIEPVRQ